METRPRTPAKETGSGLDELQGSGKEVLPPDPTPENAEAAECPCSLITFLCERWLCGWPVNGDQQH